MSRRFNGTSGRIVRPTAIFPAADPRPLSVNLWFKPDNTTGDMMLYHEGWDGSDQKLEMYLTNSPGLRYAPGGGANVNGGTFVAGAWQMFTVTHAANGDVVVYLNGASVATASRGAPVFGTEFSGPTLGALWNGGSEFVRYAGLMTAPSFYSRVLAPAELVDMYGGGTAPRRTAADSTGLIAHVPFDTSSLAETVGGATWVATGTTFDADEPPFVTGPVVSAINPTSGRATGTVVDVTVDSSTGATAVEFNNVPGSSFSIVNATTVRATTDAATTGPVSVINANGEGAGPTFTVVPVADAFRLVGAAPWAPAAGPSTGTPYTLQIEAYNVAANVRDTLFTGNVTLTPETVSAPGTIISSGTTTVAAVAGVATFTNIVFSEAPVTPPVVVLGEAGGGRHPGGLARYFRDVQREQAVAEAKAARVERRVLIESQVPIEAAESLVAKVEREIAKARRLSDLRPDLITKLFPND